MTIIDAISDEHLLKPLFKNLSTWKAWICALKCIFGLPLNDEELALYQKCTGREKPPTKPFKEIYLIVGRRGGKSFVVSAIAVFLSIFKDYSEYLSPGERGTIMIIAVDRKQAGIILRYIKAILSLPLFKAYVEREVAEGVELTNRINIEVHTASYRSVRGFTVVCGIFEESAFWRVEGANPDHEIYSAVKPAMATIPDAMLISISTPYSRQGLLYEAHKEYFGKEDDEVLVWQAPSIVMNPTLNEKEIGKQREKDLSASRAEFDAEFREDIEQFLPLEVIEKVIIPGRIELPYVEKFSYQAFFDAAAGGADFFTLSVGHKEGEKIIQDQLKARKGDPYEIAKDFSDLLKKYHCNKLKGDKYAGSWVSTAFEKEGISYQSSELNKSELYLEALAYLSAGRCELLDNKQLVKELRLLERRRGPSGKDTVDHPKSMGGGVPHDDLANVSCGMITMGFENRPTPGVFFVGQKKEPPRVDQLPTKIEQTLTAAGRRFFQGD
jgi:hypothetical protein